MGAAHCESAKKHNPAIRIWCKGKLGALKWSQKNMNLKKMKNLKKMILGIESCNVTFKAFLIALSALAIYYAGEKTGEFIYYVIN